MIQSTLRKAVWLICFSLAIVLIVLSWQYLTSDPNDYPFVQQRETYQRLRVPLLVHIGFAFIALLLGPLQFVGFIRRRFRGFHRLLGIIYLMAISVSSVASIIIAPHAFTGMVTALGFLILAGLWCATTWMAIVQVIKKDFQSHGRWMLRSYALTFAAVTLRLELLALIFGAGFSQAEAYSIVAWSCWVLNLAVVEVFIQWRRRKPMRHWKRRIVLT